MIRKRVGKQNNRLSPTSHSVSTSPPTQRDSSFEKLVNSQIRYQKFKKFMPPPALRECVRIRPPSPTRLRSYSEIEWAKDSIPHPTQKERRETQAQSPFEEIQIHFPPGTQSRRRAWFNSPGPSRTEVRERILKLTLPSDAEGMCMSQSSRPRRECLRLIQFPSHTECRMCNAVQILEANVDSSRSCYNKIHSGKYEWRSAPFYTNDVCARFNTPSHTEEEIFRLNRPMHMHDRFNFLSHTVSIPPLRQEESRFRFHHLSHTQGVRKMQASLLPSHTVKCFKMLKKSEKVKHKSLLSHRRSGSCAIPLPISSPLPHFMWPHHNYFPWCFKKSRSEL